MKKARSLLCLSGFLTCLTLVASAQGDDQISCDRIQNLLAGGSSAADVVQATMQPGLSLADATIYVLGCVGDNNPQAIATAGIAAAENLAGAQSVADAVLASEGQTGEVADAVRAALQDYIKHMPQPDVYRDRYTPTGGSDAVSPAA